MRSQPLKGKNGDVVCSVYEYVIFEMLCICGLVVLKYSVLRFRGIFLVWKLSVSETVNRIALPFRFRDNFSFWRQLQFQPLFVLRFSVRAVLYSFNMTHTYWKLSTEHRWFYKLEIGLKCVTVRRLLTIVRQCGQYYNFPEKVVDIGARSCNRNFNDFSFKPTNGKRFAFHDFIIRRQFIIINISKNRRIKFDITGWCQVKIW